MRYFDPFLVLDEFSGMFKFFDSLFLAFYPYVCYLKSFSIFCLIIKITVSAPAGFPDHPHRGSILIICSDYFLQPKICNFSRQINVFGFSSLFSLFLQALKQSPTCCRYLIDNLLYLSHYLLLPFNENNNKIIICDNYAIISLFQMLFVYIVNGCST